MSAEAISSNLSGIIDAILGDYDAVRVRSLGSSSTRRWRSRQTAGATMVMAGAASVAGIPGAGLVVTIPANLAGAGFVIRRMAHSAWGIGTRMVQGKPTAVVEPEVDLVAILALWAGAAQHEVMRIVQSLRPVKKPLVAGGLALAALPEASVGAAVLKKIGSLLYKEFGRKIAKKLQQILAKKLFGCIPVAGIAINSVGTWMLMRGFGTFAERYYAAKFSQGCER